MVGVDLPPAIGNSCHNDLANAQLFAPAQHASFSAKLWGLRSSFRPSVDAFLFISYFCSLVCTSLNSTIIIYPLVLLSKLNTLKGFSSGPS